MPRRLIAATVLAATLGIALPGCTGSTATTATSTATTASSPARPGATISPARPVTMADARRCPVTIGHPVPRSKPWRESLFGWSSAYGNGSLWVGGLWSHGVVIITPDDVGPGGSLSMKFGWYRLTSGFLTITGKRLDASAPPASGQASGYGDIGFAASGVIFPTEGCWQITGRAGKAALTYVTFVIKGHCDLNAAPIRCVANRAR